MHVDFLIGMADELISQYDSARGMVSSDILTAWQIDLLRSVFDANNKGVAGLWGVQGARDSKAYWAGRAAVIVGTIYAAAESAAAKSVDKWSRLPKSIQDKMTLEAAKKGIGRKIIDKLGDPKFKGMEKWEYKVKSANGQDSVVHYVRDPKTGKLMDFKFKKHSIDTLKPLGNDPAVPPGG